MTEIASRQVLRARARANDYWDTPLGYGRMGASKPRKCQRVSTTGRERVSSKVIAKHQPRARLSPRPAPRHPAGMKHAWQRKAAFRAALERAAGARK